VETIKEFSYKRTKFCSTNGKILDFPYNGFFKKTNENVVHLLEYI
jgi:hypothetical protein